MLLGIWNKYILEELQRKLKINMLIFWSFVQMDLTKSQIKVNVKARMISFYSSNGNSIFNAGWAFLNWCLALNKTHSH